MAHFHVKRKKGKSYLYIREISRVNGKPKVVKQTYIGSPEKVARLFADLSIDIPLQLQVEEFGSLWLANLIDRDIDLASIIDAIIPQQPQEKKPSVGEYFLYCVFNRMIEAVSKNKLADWYQNTAIQHIRPVRTKRLSSQLYWEKWDRVSVDDLKSISREFFQRVWQKESPNPDCLLFDTTNYYTFMAAETNSQLACRGKSKEGRHHLRQIGLGLLVTRDTRLPIYYREYPGNIHDSRLFENIMDEMFGIVCGLNKGNESLTVVIDKGMNSEGNYTWIDEHSRIHFITNYSTYFSEELISVPLNRFEPLDIEKNSRLLDEGKPKERIWGYRTEGEYWGKRRTVVVTFNPATARKQEYALAGKLATLKQELLVMRAKFGKYEPQWRKAEVVKERYIRLCERLHVPSDLYILEFTKTESGAFMRFHRDVNRINRKRAMFGKHIIITDNHDWMTEEIVEANLDRWQVEEKFRLSKDDDLVGTRPIRHWTDSKIRCHLFTCVAAMTYLRILELRLSRAGINRTAEDVMSDMRHLHSMIYLKEGDKNFRRSIEKPTKNQKEVLGAFGYRVTPGGVLQPINR